jgi:hypothetical protein
MSDVVPNTQHDFWRPPVMAPDPAPSPVSIQACAGCGTEFMVGAKFCHTCGAARARVSPGFQHWTRHLEFQNIAQGFAWLRDYLGLPLPSLIAFAIGVVCFVAAIAVGVIYSVQNFADFQAVQFFRMQWLLASVAAFVAGILLRRADSSSSK